MQILRSCSGYLLACCRISRSKWSCRSVIQCACLLLVLGVIVEMLALNFLLFYMYTTSKGIMASFGSVRGNLWDKLLGLGIANEVLTKGKNGGISSLLQHTLDRVYIMPVRPEGGAVGEAGKSGLPPPQTDLFVLGVDMSDAGEPLFIYKRILMRPNFRYARLVVDIGANDGLLSSNSYNFIHWGWNAILVEPLPSQIRLAKINTARYRSVYRENSQNVTFVEAVIGTKDGVESLVLSRDLVAMESHVPQDSVPDKDRDQLLRVRSMKVRTFANQYSVPKYFGVLSLDAEGMGDQILHQWIDLKFRPAYIIYEQLHNPEPLATTMEFLRQAGYTYLVKRGWNYIFEFNGR